MPPRYVEPPEAASWPKSERPTLSRQEQVQQLGTLWCPQCQTVKPVSQFSINKGTTHGYQGTCKACYHILDARTRERNALRAQGLLPPTHKRGPKPKISAGAFLREPTPMPQPPVPQVDDKSMTERARQWLPERLRNGQVKRNVLVAEAKEMGISEYALAKAQRNLGLQIKRIGQLGTSWALPAARSTIGKAEKRPAPPERQMVVRPAFDPVAQEEDTRRMPPELDVFGLLFEKAFSQNGVSHGFNRDEARHELLREMVAQNHAIVLELLRA